MNQIIRTRSVSILLVAFFVLCFAIQPLVAQEKAAEKLTATGTTMGVITWNVTAFGNPELLGEFETAIDEELEAVNQRMSTYIADSEVSIFNHADTTDWVPVSKDTVSVVERALEISAETEGDFDITVQPLVELWREAGEAIDSGSPPSLPEDMRILKILGDIGFEKLSVRLDPPAIRKNNPNLQIDLSAIAKGYAVDMVVERLKALGIDNFLVEVGGEVRTSGEKPDDTAWKVGIEKPIVGQRQIYQTVELFHKAMASSGDYRIFFEFEGQRYSHTIDPRTGKPVAHDVVAASVIASDCMTADALATALMVMEPKQGIALAEKVGAEALILSRNGETLVAHRSRAFPTASSAPAKSDNSIFRMIAIASGFFAFAIIAMAIGVIFGRERIKGSCGGIAALDNPDVTPECSLCSRAAECDDLKKAIKNRAANEP